MSEQGRNLIIGVFVIAAIVVAVWVILFLHPTIGNQDQKLQVRFTNVDKIDEGTRVTYAGRPMGQVEKLERLTDELALPADEFGNLYVWQLELGIDSSLDIYTSDEITARTAGLFGEREVAILPRAPEEGVRPIKITDQIIYATGGDQMEHAFSQISSLATKMGRALDEIADVVSQNSTLFSQTLRSVRDAARNFGNTFHDVNEQELIATFKESFENMGLLMISLKKDIDELSDKGFFDNMAKTSANVATVTGDIKDGKGTLGRLIEDDDLYLQMQSLLGKGETLLNDVNHYGILFHANKHWQRERSARATELQALQSPRAFRDYFDAEIDRIQTSLARLSEVLHRSRCECPASSLARNPCFVEELATLLREVTTLQNQLKRYNEDLQRCRTACE